MLERIFWKDIREKVIGSFPEFAEVIDELSPGDNYYFYMVRYPYGALITDKGVFQLPNQDGHIVPIHHGTIPNRIKDDLGYAGTIPLGLILENSIEAFMRAGDRIIPSSLAKAGQLISLWRVLDEAESFHAGRFWNITSGARSVCMVPKITDAGGYKSLKSRYGVKFSIPQKLSEHWVLFTEVIHQINYANKKWESGLLFFPKIWFDNKKDKQWARFYYFLFNTLWQKSAFRRNQFIFDFAFSLAQQNRNLRPNPYLADTVRHLVAVGCGAVPAFAPAIDESAAPIRWLQEVFLEGYGLKKYAPIIMHSHHFNLQDDRTVYYSVQMPTTAIFSPKSRKLSSAMEELQEVKHIMEVLLSEILRGNLEVENTPLFGLAKNVRYGYYHSEKDKSGEIYSSSCIHEADKKFTSTIADSKNYIFPEFSPFFKGCISISKAL